MLFGSKYSIKYLRIFLLKDAVTIFYFDCRTSSSCNSFLELNLLASCIKLHSVLFCIMPEDIIKCFEIFNFLPGYPVRMKRKNIQIHDMYYTQSRIYTIVCCKEAKEGVYPVLFSYLNLIHNVVGTHFTNFLLELKYVL